jgi:hypothetical protein
MGSAPLDGLKSFAVLVFQNSDQDHRIKTAWLAKWSSTGSWSRGNITDWYLKSVLHECLKNFWIWLPAKREKSKYKLDRPKWCSGYDYRLLTQRFRVRIPGKVWFFRRSLNFSDFFWFRRNKPLEGKMDSKQV